MLNWFIYASYEGLGRRIFQRLFLFLTLAGLYIPLLFFVLLSFNELSTKNTVAANLETWNGFQNYIKFFSDPSETKSLLDALFNSLLISFISIPISLFIGLMTVISIWKNYGKGQKLVFLSSNITISCPDIIQAISFVLLFSMFVIPLGFVSVILTHIAIQIPYVVVFLYPKLSKLNLNLLRASYDLNFKFFESIINVILPVLFPNLLGAALLAFTISFDDYVITNLVRGNITTVSTELYNMRTGVKLWAVVFGSIVILGVALGTSISSFYRCIKGRRLDD